MSFYKRHKFCIDQTLHFLVFGALAFAHPALGVLALVVYELTDWHLDVGPVTIGQWPPGKPMPQVDQTSKVEVVTQMANVNDLRWDLAYSCLGIIVSSIGRSFVF